MNRRRFLGTLASAAAVATVAPVVATKAAETVLIPGVPGKRIVIEHRKLWAHVTLSGPILARPADVQAFQDATAQKFRSVVDDCIAGLERDFLYGKGHP